MARRAAVAVAGGCGPLPAVPAGHACGMRAGTRDSVLRRALETTPYTPQPHSHAGLRFDRLTRAGGPQTAPSPDLRDPPFRRRCSNLLKLSWGIHAHRHPPEEASSSPGCCQRGSQASKRRVSFWRLHRNNFMTFSATPHGATFHDFFVLFCAPLFVPVLAVHDSRRSSHLHAHANHLGFAHARA